MINNATLRRYETGAYKKARKSFLKPAQCKHMFKGCHWLLNVFLFQCCDLGHEERSANLWCPSSGWECWQHIVH